MSRYVSTRSSPGSPSQMMAALFFRPLLTWRSRQLYDALSFPPMNHLAQGESHSSTFFHGLNHSNSLAALAQNACGFLRAELKTLWLFAWADFLKCFGGGKFLFSSKRTSMALSGIDDLLLA